NEEDEEQDVDSLIKLAKAAAFAADTSSIPADATSTTEVPPSSSIHTDAFVHGNDVPTGTASAFSDDPSNKGKSLMVEEDPPIKERKSLAPRKMPSSEVDLNAPDTSFITVLSDDVFDASDDDTDPLFWHIFAAWEVIPTGLGDVNALY
ncbi:hypothetical protein Tco_0376718, partial [Tanacetum coccineum]